MILDDASIVRNITSMSELKLFMSRHGIRVVKKKTSEMFGYAGIHIEKREDWGIKIPYNTIWVDESIHGRELFRTLKHEVEEMFLMRERGMKYFPAHKKAFKDETRR